MRPVIGISSAFSDNVLRVRPDYVAAIERSGGLPVILPILQQASSVMDFIDGLLLTGGGDIPPDYYHEETIVPPEYMEMETRERINFEMVLLGEALRRDRPVLALCYGMQLLNVVHGGTIFQDIEYQVQEVSDHRKGMHEIEVIDLLQGDGKNEYTVNSSHHQAVKEVGDELTVFAIAGDGIIEGIYKRGHTFCVGVQWHPERIFYDPLSLWLFESLAQKAAEVRRSRG
jgi:putative glutamine amidotransferase